jgi:hypothetical protein
VIGSVSMAWLERHRAGSRRGLLLYAGIAGALVFAAVAVLVLQGSISQLVRELIA